MAGLDSTCIVESQEVDCKGLYFPTADDGTWASADGGATWSDLRCCGDSCSAFIDPTLPGQVVTARNKTYAVYRSKSGSTRGLPPTSVSELLSNIVPPNAYDGIEPPGQAAFSQVMTLLAETPLAAGDCVTLESPFRTKATAWPWSQPRTEVVAGDFNGDKQLELAALYDFGADDTALFLFPSDGSASNLTLRSGAGNWNWSRSKMVAGDFIGDGKAEIGVLYDYGDDNTGLFLFCVRRLGAKANLA